ESVLAVGKEPRLVEELGGLEVCEATMQIRFGQLGDGLQEGEGHFGPDDRGGLEEAFLLGWQPVDARRQHRLHRRRHLQAGQRLPQGMAAAFAYQHLRLDERLHALLQEEGITFGTGDQEWGERYQTRVSAQECLQQLVCRRRGQWVEPYLGVKGLTAPAVLILRAVVDQEEDAGGGQALDQAVEERLRLGIDPVQVFEDQQQRLHLAL